MTSPYFEPLSPGKSPAMRPIYPLCAGVTQKMLTNALKFVLAGLGEDYEPLPQYIVSPLKLCSYSEALQNIHMPSSDAALSAAKRRLEFEQLFYYLLGLNILRQKGEEQSHYQTRHIDDAFVKQSPFTPTCAQARVISEIRSDLGGGNRMNRLLQGDFQGLTARNCRSKCVCHTNLHMQIF